MQDELSPQDGMRLINEMIGKAKRSYVTKGYASIVWGLLIMICSIVTWAQIHFQYDLPFDIWLLTLIAVAVQIFFGIRDKKKRNFTSHNETTVTYTWIAFGISTFIMSFYNARYGSDESTTPFLILYGIPTFITGGIFNFRPMIIGGLTCWIFAIVSLFTIPEIDMLLMAGAGFFAWLIPGIIIFRHYQKNRQQDV